MMTTPCHPCARGFTLMELLVAMAVAAVLATIAVPSYQRFIAAQRVKAAASALNHTMLFARSEAIKRNASVVVAPIGGCWQGGWTVRVGATTLTTESGFPDVMIASAIAPASSVAFNAEGRVDGSATPFEVSSRAAGDAGRRCVSLDLSGLPATQRAVCREAVATCS